MTNRIPSSASVRALVLGALRPCLLVAAGLLIGAAGEARAQVVEPNGLSVPIVSNNGELRLDAFFAQRGEAINWQADAHVAPALFSPRCDFTATYVLNQAGSHFGLAWYNADPNAQNPPQNLYTLVPPNSPVGAQFQGALILQDPNYAGGLIGFALVGGQTHYSEQRWNVACQTCAKPGPWALALIYQSKVTPNAYYLAFEDGAVNAASFDNDGDFNDDVYFVTGISCSGAGAACDTGLKGICADGIEECDGAGGLRCRQLSKPATVETCDGLDEDCNGVVDDGAMCPMNQVCDRGRCVDPCGAAEFSCGAGFECDNGFCVESGCVGMRCPAGQVCHLGHCAGACDGIVCPHGEQCRAGRCVDPCMGVTCPMNEVCERGACISSCDCQACPKGRTCQKDGHCADPACVGKTCMPGEYCSGGQCIDGCNSAVCPTGEACMTGACFPYTPPDMAEPEVDLGVFVLGDDGGAQSTGDGGGSGLGHLRGGCKCGVGRAGSEGDAGGSDGLGEGLLVVGAVFVARGRRRGGNSDGPRADNRAAR